MIHHLAFLLVLASTPEPALTRVEQAGTETWKPCHFAWPLPTSVWVTQDSEKGGQRATMRYRVTLSGANDGEHRARLNDFDFLMVSGRDVTSPEAREELAPILAMAQAVPDMVVDTNGIYLRMDGVDEMVDRIVALLASQGESEAKQKQLLVGMKSPSARAMFEAAGSGYWNTWVGAWVGFDLQPGQESVEEQETSFMGVVLPAVVTKRNLGFVAEHPGHVELFVTTVMEGPSATSAFAESMAEFARQSGSPPFPKNELIDMRSVSVVTVVTDAATLKPLRASQTKTVRIEMEGEGAKEQVERAEYTFDWTAGGPTGAK